MKNLPILLFAFLFISCTKNNCDNSNIAQLVNNTGLPIDIKIGANIEYNIEPGKTANFAVNPGKLTGQINPTNSPEVKEDFEFSIQNCEIKTIELSTVWPNCAKNSTSFLTVYNGQGESYKLYLNGYYFNTVKLNLPVELVDATNIHTILRKYKIKDVGFGNWVTVEDKINYVNALTLAFYDLNQVLKFNYNIGMNETLSVSFGARGKGRALAHYEPKMEVINITRYKRANNKFDKLERFLNTGGIGSFAHEYGHFLDYFAGKFLDKNSIIFPLSGGHLINKKLPQNTGGELRELTNEILDSLIFTDGKTSSFYNRISGLGEYWIRRNEIFARAFEVYIKTELERKDIFNVFLTDTKYSGRVYPTPAEFKPTIPLFREWAEVYRHKIK